MRKLNDFKLSEHFNLREFQCPCCERVKLAPELVEALENIRGYIGKPIIIKSGYRCVEHNGAVGGANDSDHLYGWAADIKVKGMKPAALARVASFYPSLVKRIGTYPDKNCVHVGCKHREGLSDKWGGWEA